MLIAIMLNSIIFISIFNLIDVYYDLLLYDPIFKMKNNYMYFNNSILFYILYYNDKNYQLNWYH